MIKSICNSKPYSEKCRWQEVASIWDWSFKFQCNPRWIKVEGWIHYDEKPILHDHQCLHPFILLDADNNLTTISEGKYPFCHNNYPRLNIPALFIHTIPEQPFWYPENILPKVHWLLELVGTHSDSCKFLYISCLGNQAT